MRARARARVCVCVCVCVQKSDREETSFPEKKRKQNEDVNREEGIGEQRERQTDKRTARQRDRPTDWRTDKYTNKQTDRDVIISYLSKPPEKAVKTPSERSSPTNPGLS